MEPNEKAKTWRRRRKHSRLSSKVPLNTSMSVIQFPRLSDIRIGQPDANVEYINSIRSRERPIYIDSFFTLPQFPLEDFISGQNFLIYGQKGTGKTAALRYIQDVLGKTHSTEFIIFKRAFLEESDLLDITKIPLAVDEEELKGIRHYHHAIKRILIMIILKKVFNSFALDGGDQSDSFYAENRTFVDRVRSAALGDLIQLGFDSIKTIIDSAQVDIGKLTGETVLANSAKALKRNNDDLLSYLVRRLRRKEAKIAIFVDEIHFAYRSEESLQQDAMLVRDCLLAIHALSDRFVEEGVDVRIYAAVRAEYLEHPIISSADINHTVESIGYQLSWSNFPVNLEHPLLHLIYQRFKLSIGEAFRFGDFLSVYMRGVDIDEFMNRTWSKPRDFIRFFKCAKDLYPNLSALNRSQLNTVWRRYAQEAWNEIKSSASPFMNGSSIAALESVFRDVVPNAISSRHKHSYEEFSGIMRPIYDIARGNNKAFYDFDHFLDLLYILGIFGTRKQDENQLMVIQSYHRGNRSYQRDGEIVFHPTVLKAFG
ncbi:P-loop ATPase, Sll1717 family [Devosia geojensis]|uniref:P-loop ATPase, Sll1717 family n=1 Tax=Devosia geojensis TaxID=443610 RepID=UPI000A8BDC8A|nr:hypothetical protein [Devosia geojensis]